MNASRFATRHWAGYIALVVVFAIVCALLSWWQWARRDEAAAEVQRITSNYDAPPVPLSELVPTLGSWDPEIEYRPVVMTGEYRSSDTLLVRTRPFDGRIGFAVLVPFELNSGEIVFVDRGWWPASDDGTTVAERVPAPPSGVVNVVARLRAEEPSIPGRSAPEGQLATIHLADAFDAIFESGYSRVYGQLVSEDPSVATMPFAAPKPKLDEGPHLSYALQWILFALVAIVGLVWAIRRDRRDAPETSSDRSVDAEFEDAALDAADASR